MLEMIRGDTAGFNFQRKDADGNVITTIAEELYFTVKGTPKDTNPAFQITVDEMTFDPDGTYHFIVKPEDTNSLSFKNYYYDLEVIQNGVKTTIAFGQIQIKPEVTWAVNEVDNG